MMKMLGETVKQLALRDIKNEYGKGRHKVGQVHEQQDLAFASAFLEWSYVCHHAIPCRHQAKGNEKP